MHYVTQTSSMSNSRCSFVVDATSTSFSCDDEGRSTPFSSYSPSLAVKYSSVRMWGKRNYLKVDGKYTHTCMYEHMQACMHTHAVVASFRMPSNTKMLHSLTHHPMPHLLTHLLHIPARLQILQTYNHLTPPHLPPLLASPTYPPSRIPQSHLYPEELVRPWQHSSKKNR